MNITDLLGKRCLLRIPTGRYGSSEVAEYKVQEISPSGTWVRIMNIHGNKFWHSIADIAFIEELVDLKADKPKKEKS